MLFDHAISEYLFTLKLMRKSRWKARWHLRALLSEIGDIDLCNIELADVRLHIINYKYDGATDGQLLARYLAIRSFMIWAFAGGEAHRSIKCWLEEISPPCGGLLLPSSQLARSR